MIIHDTHEGLNANPESIALSGHRGRDSTHKKIAERFFWHGIVEDVKDYINICEMSVALFTCITFAMYLPFYGLK